MPYCSIQEAWGTDFYENKNQPKRFQKIVPELAREESMAYNNVNYPETDVYDSSANSIYHKRQKKPTRKRKSFSRSYNRLPEHSGPESRLPNSSIQYRLGYDTEKHLVEEESPIYENTDLPNNQFDNRLEESLNDSKEEFQSNSTYINRILKENIELKKIIENFNNKSIENDNIFDLVLFISSGVFIIFLLDMMSKAIRRF